MRENTGCVCKTARQRSVIGQDDRRGETVRAVIPRPCARSGGASANAERHVRHIQRPTGIGGQGETDVVAGIQRTVGGPTTGTEVARAAGSCDTRTLDHVALCEIGDVRAIVGKAVRVAIVRESVGRVRESIRLRLGFMRGTEGCEQRESEERGDAGERGFCFHGSEGSWQGRVAQPGGRGEKVFRGQAPRDLVNRRASFVSRLFMACFRGCRAHCKWQGQSVATRDARHEPENRALRCEDFVTLWFIQRTLG